MATRREAREQARAERLRREREAQTRAARRRRFAVGGTVALVAAVAVAIVLAISGGGPGNRASAASRPDIAPSQLIGMSAGPAPWAPDYSGLVQRLTTLQLPQPSDVIYHVHAILYVYVDGKQQTVPANVGIDERGGTLASLHTHDTTGVIHMEAVEKFPFRLSDFFDVWGVVLTPTQLGSYRNAGAKTMHFYVNGHPLRMADPTRYVIKPHDDIVVAYGRDGSFPTKPSTAALAGL